MHRPAPSDLDASFGPALLHDPSLVGPVERLKRLVAEGDFTEAASRLRSLDEGWSERSCLQWRRERLAGAASELADALGPEAYWRAADLEARPRDRGGPADEHPLRDCRAGGRLHARDP